MRANDVRLVVEPVVEQAGLELDSLVVSKAGSRELLRIAVDGDGPDGRGPTLDEVAAVSQAISAALDASQADGDRPYVLEVGTRGVGKPLQRPAHWRRNAGRLVRVTFPEAPELTGRIVAADDSGATVEAEGSLVQLNYGDVVTAVVQVELNRPGDPLGADADPAKEES